MKRNELEKKFKKDLENYESFEGDKMAMWDNIEQELDGKKKRGFFWAWFGTGVLVLGLAVTLLFFGENETPQLIENGAASSSILQQSEVTKTQSSTSNNFTLDNGTILSDKATEVENKKPSANFIFPEEQTPLKKTAVFIDRKNDTPPFEKLTLTTEDARSSIVSVEQEIEAVETKTKTTSTLISNPTANVATTAIATASSAEDFNFLPPLYAELDLKEKEIFKLEMDTLFIPRKDKNEDAKLWALNLGGGLLTNTSGFNNKSSFRKETNSPELGWSFQLELERQLPKSLYLASGIHFNRHFIQFDYQSITEEERLLEDVILSFEVDVLSGDTTFVYGNRLVNATTERNVRHHNRYDKIKIPILFGKKWAKEKFSYGVFAGVGLDIWLRQTGRNLSADEFVFTYDSQDEETVFPKFGISADFRGVFNYSVGKNSALFIQPNLSFSMKDWSPSYNEIKQRPITFGINLGYQIKF